MFEGCKPCDEDGLNCVDDLATLKRGYWWEWRNVTHKTIYENFTAYVVDTTFRPVVKDSLIKFPYTLPRPHKCPREESCMGGLDSPCAVGYDGPLCEVCSAGYYKQFKTCLPCPTKKWMVGQLSILAAVVLIVIFVVVWISAKKRKKDKERSLVDIVLGRLKIVIGFYQVTFGVIEAFSYVKWPDSLVLIGKYSEMLQLNIFQIAPLHCLFPNLKVDAFGSLFAMLALNATAIAAAFAAYGLRKLTLIRSTLEEEQKLEKTSQTKELIYKNLFFFLYITYLSTFSKAASVLPLACQTLCFDEKEGSCQTFLKADYKIKCSSPQFNRSVIVSYCTILYLLSLPTAALVALWRQRSHFRKKVTAMMNENCDLEEQNPGACIFTGLRFLYENYNAHSWYWELVETARKVTLTSGLILVGGESRAYVGLACVMSGFYGMLFAYKKPICDPFENKLMLASLAATFFNLGIGAVSRIPKESIPSSIDPYMDSIMFKAVVFGTNSLVIGLLVGE